MPTLASSGQQMETLRSVALIMGAALIAARLYGCRCEYDQAGEILKQIQGHALSYVPCEAELRLRDTRAAAERPQGKIATGSPLAEGTHVRQIALPGRERRPSRVEQRDRAAAHDRARRHGRLRDS